MNQPFTYFAFISYSLRDKHIAQKIHRHLEHYKLPKCLRSRFPHLPQNLRPIFFDSMNLSISSFQDALLSALTASRYLIVICSENSARLNADGISWVNEEVRLFLSLRPENYNRVIPIILREKGGASASDCLLPAIQEHGILGVDMLVKGEERTLNDVVAKMVGLEPDMLWGRHERKQRVRSIRRRVLGGIAAALTAIAGWYLWEYYTPHFSYYTDYVERDNIPEGLFPLTEEQVRAQHRHYRFTTYKYRLRTVEYCNSSGTPQEHTEPWQFDRSARIELLYQELGGVERSIHSNAKGQETYRRRFTPGCIDFTRRLAHKEEISQSAPLPASWMQNTVDKGETAIGRFMVKRNAEGVITQELYTRTFSSTPQKDAQGISGRAYEVDTTGRRVSVRYLASNEHTSPRAAHEYAINAGGSSGYTLAYDEKGHVVSVTCVNKEGTPTINEALWATARHLYSSDGNMMERSYYNAAGKPCTTWEGFHRCTMRYEQGNLKEIHYFNTTGLPCLHYEGYSQLKRTHDEQGHVIEEACFGTDGKPCLSCIGVSRTRWLYDERDNIIEESCFGVEGQLCLNIEGYASRRWRYDARGNIIEESCFGTDGRPCLNKEGYASRRWQYDERGNKLEESYFDMNGSPCHSTAGASRIIWQYDERGNMIEESYYASDGLPCTHAEGYARTTYVYDMVGNLIEQSFYGPDGRPCLHNDGYARHIRRYDERGHMVEEAFFGTNGTPCQRQDGVARITRQYDELGQVSNETFYDLNGNIIGQ